MQGSPLTPFADEGRFRKLKWWCNLVFILGALCGMAIYMWGDKTLGTYILIASTLFKFIEVALRILKL